MRQRDPRCCSRVGYCEICEIDNMISDQWNNSDPSFPTTNHSLYSNTNLLSSFMFICRLEQRLILFCAVFLVGEPCQPLPWWHPPPLTILALLPPSSFYSDPRSQQRDKQLKVAETNVLLSLTHSKSVRQFRFLIMMGTIILYVCGTIETIGMEMRVERKIIICSHNNFLHSAHCEHVDLVDCSEFSSDEMTCMLTATGMTCCVCTATLRQMNEWKVFGWVIYLFPLSLLCIFLEWSVFVISPLVQTEPSPFLVMMSILFFLWIIWSPFVL